MEYLRKFYLIFEEEIISILYKLFLPQKERKEYIPTHSTRSALTPKLRLQFKKKVYRSKSLMNMLANILNKMSANQILYITHALRLSEA